MLLLVVAALATALAGCSDPRGSASQPTPGAEARGAGELAASVQRVVDGDTIRARTGPGRTERVRLLGIDAPEVSDTRTGSAQCGGAEAFAELASLLPRGTPILLVTDPSQDRRDRFGRLLAYVRQPGVPGTVQEQLLADGWARVYVFDRDRPFARVDAFRAAAAQARRSGAGVWDECGGDFRRPVQ
jgi:micrococcal nuclease